ncbi:MAG: phage terminase large subunit [Candidatus Omnitrophica bacterium]|nr:phage terminase large subunit [Candidatus Omnitrophota bacterium]
MAEQKTWTEANEQEYYRLLLEEDYDRCEKSLSNFVQAAWHTIEPGTQYNHNWHIDLICEYLTAVYLKQIKRLIINIPYRYSKSILASVMFPSWVWLKEPASRWIFASYAQDLSTELSLKRRRVIQSEWYQARWADRYKIVTDQNIKTWFTNNKEGAMLASSVGGSITGRGGNCLDGGTLIKTITGNKEIKKLKKGDLVLTQGEGLCYNKVVATKKSTTDTIYEITIGKNIIRSTGQHRFFIPNKGYIKAENLRPGDKVISVEQILPKMWERKSRQGTILQNMLFSNEESRHFSYLRLLCQRFLQKGIRYKESQKAWTQRFILFFGLFSKTSCYKKQQKMYYLWKTSRRKTQKILFNCLQRDNQKNKRSSIKATKEIVSYLFSNLSTIFFSKTILFSQLCQQGTLNKNERAEQFILQGWNKLFKMVSRNERNYFTKRWAKLCSMWGNKKVGDPSFKREGGRQYNGEFSSDVSTLPYNPSQIEEQSISNIERISVNEYPVYDIQVDKTSNFFANEILVHNCLIGDDLLKAEEAFSKVKRDAANLWFDQTFSTRLNDRKKDAIIIIQHRLHKEDTTGHLLKKKAQEYQYEVLSLPLIAKRRTVITYPVSKKQIIREENDLLWPEMDSQEEIADKKESLGSFGFSAQCQQDPEELGGEMIKRHWWQYYRELPNYSLKFQSLDTALETKDDNAYSVCLTVVECGNGWYITDVWRYKVESPELKRAVKQLYNKELPDEVLIEKKASGHGLIQELRRETRMPVKGIEVDKDKVSRVNAVIPTIEAGKVFLPEDASWVIDFVDELAVFPHGAYNDQVDALTQLLIYRKKATIDEPGSFGNPDRGTQAGGSGRLFQAGGGRLF